LRNDAESYALRDQATNGFEGAHSGTEGQLLAQPGGMRVDVLLQSSPGKSHELFVQDVQEKDLLFCGKGVASRDSNDQPVDGEGLERQPCRVDGIGDDTGFGKPGGHGFDDIDALPFLQLDIDVRVRGKPGSKAVGQKFRHCGGVCQQTNSRAQALCNVTELSMHLRELTQDNPCMVSQRIAGLCRDGPPSSALKQLHPAGCFHVPQPLAGGSQ
jgi:hypothetical protein